MIRYGRGLRNETMILFCPKNVSCEWDKGSVDRCFLTKTTHPNLPKGKELVTQNTVISPHLASPEGEGQLLLILIIY